MHGAFLGRGATRAIVETFLVESWLEHLRQHERVTQADRQLEEQLQAMLRSEPEVTHLIRAS